MRSLQAAGVFLTLVALVLIADSMLRQPGAFEYYLINAVQSIDVPHAGGVVAFITGATSLSFLLIAWASLLVVSAVARRWGAFVATFITPILAGGTVAVDQLVQTRVAPDPSVLERAIPQTGFFAFSSAQVVGAVLIYGLLLFFARSIQSRPIRVALQSTGVIVIVLVGAAQLWLGSLWPSDALTAYAIGGLLLIPLLLIAQRIDLFCGKIPLVRAAEVPHDESEPHAHALTSTIIFNGPTVSKIYRPGFLPRAIYWAAFQAEFPYMRNQAALRAAVQRRNLIGLLTEYWYGSSHVARALRIDQVEGRSAITSEFISGSEPSDYDDARQFLVDLVQRFEAAGLPTWQIDPLQPRAMDNLLEADDGTYKVVDLESGLVSPMASVRSWMRAIRRGLVPMFDDVFFDVTRSYIESHDAEMRAEKGDVWVQRLYSTLDATERETSAWHESEPRVWSRLLGRRRRDRGQSQSRQHWAIDWFEGAISSWRSEDLLSAAEARRLREKVRSPQFQSIMPHFAVHLGTGVFLRFPLGSIVRASYTTVNLARLTWRFIARRIDRNSWREGVGVHSPLVILLAAIPGFGAFAYLASSPIRSDQLLLRVGIDAMMAKLPWNLYQRTGLRWVVVQFPEIAGRMFNSSEDRRRMCPVFAWADEHRSSNGPGRDPWSSAVASGLNAGRIF